MMLEDESDTKNTIISDLPASSPLQIRWLDEKDNICSKWEEFSHRPEINYNLLQVTVRNRVVVFDLSGDEPHE